VLELDAGKNQVLVGPVEALDKQSFVMDRCNWIPFENLDAPVRAVVKIRYNHSGCEATIRPVDRYTARVDLHTAQRAITPGQACVVYQGDLVLGGGWIRKTVAQEENEKQPSEIANETLAK
jgi:tRNA-specific 2-thiouridylase